MPAGTAVPARGQGHCAGCPHTCDWRDNAAAVAGLIAGYACGRSLRALARQHACTPALVSKILQAHGVERRRGRPRGAGPGEAAGGTGRPRCLPGAHVCRWAVQGLPVDQMLAEYLLGSSMAGIGHRHGRAAGTVARLLEVHAVRRRSRVEQGARRPTEAGGRGSRPAGPLVAALAAEHAVPDRWVRAVLRGARLAKPAPAP